MGLCCSFSKNQVLEVGQILEKSQVGQILEIDKIIEKSQVGSFTEVTLKDEILIKIAFKANKGTKCLLIDNINYNLEINEDINTWIKDIFSNSEWTNWIIFNNQQEKDHSSKGHSKGFLLWNEKEI